MPQVELKLGEIVRVKNVGEKLFRGFWDSIEYIIAPGAEDYLPFEAMKLFLGDPRSTNATRTLRDSRGLTSFLPDRPTEVRRLRLLYNHGFGEFTGNEPREQVFDLARIPHMEVYTLRGDRVYTVLDDPSGTSVMSATTTISEHDQLRETVERQGQLIRAMMARMGGDAGEVDDALLGNQPKRNVYNPVSDEIEPEPDDPDADPVAYNDLPEDRDILSR